MNRAVLALLLLAPVGVFANGDKSRAPAPTAPQCRAHHDGKEYEKAFPACGAAAKAGDLESQYLLGRLYEKGNGVSRDLVTALRWYRSAAEKGHAASQRRMAAAYAFGLGGITKDEAKAVEWLKRAAAGGDRRAQKQLAEGYRYGEGGLPKDEKLAREWQERAERGKTN